jgi:flagellar protein FlaF
MSLQAYKQAATRAEAPRDMEYRLFGQVTRALMHAATVHKSDVKTRIDAIDWNRRLWSTLSMACSSPGNGLPKEVRANLISLEIFVSKYSSDVMRGQGDFETLIEINRSIMQGLSGATVEP